MIWRGKWRNATTFLASWAGNARYTRDMGGGVFKRLILACGLFVSGFVAMAQPIRVAAAAPSMSYFHKHSFTYSSQPTTYERITNALHRFGGALNITVQFLCRSTTSRLPHSRSARE